MADKTTSKLTHRPSVKGQQVKALALYRQGYNAKDIAAQLGVSYATVRCWKSRGNWDDTDAVLQQRVNRVATHKTPLSAVDAEMMRDVENNPELTDRLRAFCLHYARTYNGTAAAIRAGYAQTRAAKTASELLQLGVVQEEIKRLKQLRNTALLASAEDVVEKYMQIAFADLSDFVAWGRSTIDVMGPNGPVMAADPDSGEAVPLKREVNEVRFLESACVDGTLLAEVKQGKDGVSVKLADRMRALEWLSKYFEMNPADRHRREYDLRKLELELLKVEHDIPAPEQAAPDDGFLTALGAQAKTMWPDGFQEDTPHAPGATQDESATESEAQNTAESANETNSQTKRKGKAVTTPADNCNAPTHGDTP